MKIFKVSFIANRMEHNSLILARDPVEAETIILDMLGIEEFKFKIVEELDQTKPSVLYYGIIGGIE